MLEFLFGYWIGRDSQKDPIGTAIGLALVLPGLYLAFLAYDAFVNFTKAAWISYLTYSAYVNLNTDFVALVVLFVLNFAVVRAVGESKNLKPQLALLFEKSISALVLPWVLFDALYKTKFFEKMAMTIGGDPSSLSEPMLMPFIGDGVSFYSLTVGVLGVASMFMPFVVIGMVAYMVYLSNKSATENTTNVAH